MPSPVVLCAALGIFAGMMLFWLLVRHVIAAQAYARGER